MSDQYDLIAKQPVSVLNRELTINPKEFFKSLGKAGVSGVFGDLKGVAENAIEALSSFAPEKKPSAAAWLLIYRALTASLAELVRDYQDCFSQDKENIAEAVSDKLEKAFSAMEVGINADFFEHPQSLSLFKDLESPLRIWLEELGMEELAANAFNSRLKQVFALHLHKEWQQRHEVYSCIETTIKTPFTKAVKDERAWNAYHAWLKEQPNQRMFAEAFSLSQVYVPLRAYYKIKVDDQTSDDELERVSPAQDSNGKVENHVVDLHEEMLQWVRDFDKNDAIKVVRGGPGCGKSSFAKTIASEIANKHPEVLVLFVPLHHFDMDGDLVDSVQKFIRDDIYLAGIDNPLNPKEGQKPLLLIFDGLDELSMQGKGAAETANAFVEEVIAKINRFNDQGSQRQAIITGRDVAITSAANKLRGQKQILHVLPYVVDKHERNELIDPKKLLATDQRDIWWQRYGKAKNKDYTAIPSELNIEQLLPITKEPLLNYLVALSYEREAISFSEQTTLNEIYEDLLTSVYKRQWDHGNHKSTKDLDEDKFKRVLEEIALAVWHGNGRVATLEKIHQQCEKSKLLKNLDAFKAGAKGGVSRLLTAFYFKESDKTDQGDKTFEFTHKSFGEYLIAKRIVRAVDLIHRKLEENQNDPDDGFDEKGALKRWAEICGPTTMDQYVFKFVCDEISLEQKHCEARQKTFAHLLGFAIRKGMPMEKLGLNNFKTMMEYSRNAEECLMVIHHACAQKTQRVSDIDFGEDRTAFGTWLKRIQQQRSIHNNMQILSCLSHLNLENSNLLISNLLFANLEGCNLKRASLNSSVLELSNLKNVDFREADLFNVRLNNANLKGANFEGASLYYADLDGAHLSGANLERANLLRANLLRARNLDKALNLDKARLPKGFKIPKSE